MMPRRKGRGQGQSADWDAEEELSVELCFSPGSLNTTFMLALKLDAFSKQKSRNGVVILSRSTFARETLLLRVAPLYLRFAEKNVEREAWTATAPPRQFDEALSTLLLCAFEVCVKVELSDLERTIPSLPLGFGLSYRAMADTFSPASKALRQGDRDRLKALGVALLQGAHKGRAFGLARLFCPLINALHIGLSSESERTLTEWLLMGISLQWARVVLASDFKSPTQTIGDLVKTFIAALREPTAPVTVTAGYLSRDVVETLDDIHHEVVAGFAGELPARIAEEIAEETKAKKKKKRGGRPSPESAALQKASPKAESQLLLDHSPGSASSASPGAPPLPYEVPPCSVCLERPKTIRLGCGHCFCEPCVSTVRTSAREAGGPVRCPMCREDVSEKEDLRVFLD